MSNKSRLMTIYKILQNTDEDHSLTTNEIIKELEDTYHIKVGRITLKKDISSLIQEGCDIVEDRKQQNRYYLGDRYFELSELRVLIDAIEASKLISPSKFEKLINKLYAFTSPYQREKLSHQNHYMDNVKSTNEEIYYIIDKINIAITNEQTIQFQYYDYDVDKNRYKKHDGQWYILSPYQLLWSQDYYYVVGYSHQHDKYISFRTDRIAGIPIPCDEPFHAIPDNFDIQRFTVSSFQMYKGVARNVVLKCDKDVMKYIIDRFGEDVTTVRIDKDTFKTKIRVGIGPTFFSWVFGFQDKIEIISPPKVRKRYAEIIDEAYQRLHQEPKN